jgi:hypothetical protein
MRDNKQLLKLVQDAIDNGATTAEEVHKSIARLPLKVLAELKVLSKPVKEVDRIQDLAIGALYDLIRDINERVAKYAARLLAKASPRKVGKTAAPKAKPKPKPKPKVAKRRATPKKRTAPARKKTARR